MRERSIFLRCPAAAFFTRDPYIISANGRMLIHNVRSGSHCDKSVRFLLPSSAGWGQALPDYPRLRCRCRSRARASLRTRHQGPSIMGFEDEAEQSLPRPCCWQVQADIRTLLIHRPARDDAVRAIASLSLSVAYSLGNEREGLSSKYRASVQTFLFDELRS